MAILVEFSRVKMEKKYTINQIARLLGVHKNTIFYWEANNKIPKPKRDPMSNYRIWTGKDLERLRKITKR
jgi:DNA-binding transcriptional MerR regulator